MEHKRNRKRKNICLLPVEIDLLDALTKSMGIASHSATIVRVLRDRAKAEGIALPEPAEQGS